MENLHKPHGQLESQKKPLDDSFSEEHASHQRQNDRAVDFRYLAERLRALYYLPNAGHFQPPAATCSQSMPHRSAIDWFLDAIVYTYYRNLRIPGPTMPLSLARVLRGSLGQLGNRSQPNKRRHHQYPTA